MNFNFIKTKESLISNNNFTINSIKNILVYNGFQFHYEMFGFILDFCNKLNYNIILFNKFHNKSWNDVYSSKYNYKLVNSISIKLLNEMDIILLLTDDDSTFSEKLINKYNYKVFCVDHYFKNRRPSIKNHIPIFNFKNMEHYILSIFSFIDLKKKQNILSNKKKQSIIFLGNKHPTCLNEISSVISNYKDYLIFIIGRVIHYNKSSSSFEKNIYLYENIPANKMFDLLTLSNFLCLLPNKNKNHNDLNSISASVQLSFTTGCKLIIDKKISDKLKLKSTIKISNSKPIILNPEYNLKEIFDERDELINKRDQILLNNFNKNLITDNNLQKIPKIIHQTWENKNLSSFMSGLVNKWKTYNPTYKHILYDNNDCLNFIKNNFGKEYLITYNKIIPGALKADFWRYCILYIKGGIYVDIDTLCMNKLDNIISKNEDFVSVVDFNKNKKEGIHNIFNGFIATVPHNPIMLNATNRIINTVLHNKIPRSILDFSGPGVLGRELNIFLNRKEISSFINKEGTFYYNNYVIKLLKFVENSEYVKDIKTNYILFQNKNGNSEISYKYKIECIKNNIKPWVGTNKILK